MASATETSPPKAEPDHFRYERKFVTGWPYHDVISLLKRNRAHFREIHRERAINNIYFDTPDFANYFANDNGIQDRLKTRIRWYGSLQGEIARPVLEIKVKRGWAGEKPSFPLAPFSLGSSFSSLDAQAHFRRSNLPGWIHQRVLPEAPNVINRYHRRYFLSADGQCRLTIDRDLRFYRCPIPGAFLPRHHEPRESLIIEMKYACKGDRGVDVFSNDFRFRLTKFSKYATGINLLYR